MVTSLSITADAVRVMVNGKLAKLADLKSGMRVRAMLNRLAMSR